jgi:pimeloyl-ACP methyl ester carboxylesterase
MYHTKHNINKKIHTRHVASFVLVATMAATSSSPATCTSCNGPLGRGLIKSAFWFMTSPNDYTCENPDKVCAARLCTACHGKRPLMIATNTSDPEDMSTASIKCLCQACFDDMSTLDFTKTFETIEGTSNAVFVFAHGGSGTRQMFHHHALDLKAKFGHSSILLDFPGHGSLVNRPLTLATATETIQSVLQECASFIKNKKMIYVGGSLGGYIGFYALKELQDQFHAAVIMDAGQNVGPGCSFKARAGLVVLNYIGKHMTNEALMKLMWGEMKKSKITHWYHLMPSTFGAGMFFDQAPAQVTCLKEVAPATLLPSYADKMPILYMNGSDDHRDSETKWKGLSTAKGSELHVYQGGDHFFTHDERFVEDILTRMDALVKIIL